MRVVFALVLCLGAAVPGLGFPVAPNPASLVRRASPLLRRSGSSIRVPASPGLRMAFDEAAAKEALERGRQREAAMVEKRRAREAKEREKRQLVRDSERDLVMGGGARFVASKASTDIGLGGDDEAVELSPEAVAKNLEIIQQGSPKTNTGKLGKVLKKRSGQTSVVLEYKRASGDEDEVNHVDMRRYSAKLRELKLDVLFADVSSQLGLTDCQSFIREQTTAKGGFPGPVPVVATGVTSAMGVAEAKAAGCQGALVSYAVDGADDLVKACLCLGLEPVTLVESENHVDAAVAAGAKILCTAPVSAEIKAPEAAKAAQVLKARMPKDVIAIAALDSHVGGPPSEVFAPGVDQTAIELGEVADKDAYNNFSFEVLNYVAALRDVSDANGSFTGIVAMRAIQTAGKRVERNYGEWLLEKLLSKKSAGFSMSMKVENPTIG
jgi:indole-3-glycerol phosphate synthase